jgi:hypothetical protein
MTQRSIIVLLAVFATSIVSCSHPLDNAELKASVLHWTEINHQITAEQLEDAGLWINNDALRRGIAYAIIADSTEKRLRMCAKNADAETAELLKYTALLARARAKTAFETYFSDD